MLGPNPDERLKFARLRKASHAGANGPESTLLDVRAAKSKLWAEEGAKRRPQARYAGGAGVLIT